MTLAQLLERKIAAGEHNQDSDIHIERDVMDISLSNETLRGTAQETAVDRGLWLSIYLSAKNAADRVEVYQAHKSLADLTSLSSQKHASKLSTTTEEDRQLSTKTVLGSSNAAASGENRFWWSRGHFATKISEIKIPRLTGAVIRMFCVLVMLLTPSLLLTDLSNDTTQIFALFALGAGALIFSEYLSVYPGLIEFRDAPPFNRLRFSLVFLTVLFVSLSERSAIYPSSITTLAHTLGSRIGMAMDFEFSPVRVATWLLSSDATADQIGRFRTAAGIAYLVSLLCFAIFVTMLKYRHWPSRTKAFNLWTNLPSFDPTEGRDAVQRLKRDARVNIILGAALPFLVPSVVKFLTPGLAADVITSPQTLIWIISAWAFLPASLLMRGMALGMIADMILEVREARANKTIAELKHHETA